MVTLHVWQLPRHRLPRALARVARDRGALRRLPGVRFAKVLGTGDGATMRLRDATPDRWALLLSWDRARDASTFGDSAVARRWASLATGGWSAALKPLSSKGMWSRREPFGEPVPDPAYAGPVAALTRARLRLPTAARFWRSLPAVAAELRDAPGLRFAMGVGEAPLGLQGTFSLWDDAAAVREFAYRRAAHRDVVARTRAEGWYAEELFARFAVLDVAGLPGWGGTRA